MKKTTALALVLAMLFTAFGVVTAYADESSEVSEESISFESSAASEESTASEESAASSEDSAVSEESVSSEESSSELPVNLVAGSNNYTYFVVESDGKVVENLEGDDGYFWKRARDDNHTLLTDGKVRSAFQLKAGGEPTRGITLELAGTNRTFSVEFQLGEVCTLNSVVLDGLRRGNNRFCHILKIEAKVGGVWQDVAFTETETVIPDSQQYALEQGGEGKDQFFTVEETFSAPVANATAVKFAFDTNPGGASAAEKYALAKAGEREFIVQLDEVRVMGVKGGTTVPVTSSEESGSGQPAVSTGDTGIAAFAILSIIAGAALVVLKKKA